MLNGSSAQAIFRRYGGLFAIVIVAAVVQFFGPPFSRQLLDYDDQTFVAPLRNLWLHDYFTTWLPQKEHYAFLLRDLTYAFDFLLSKTLCAQVSATKVAQCREHLAALEKRAKTN